MSGPSTNEFKSKRVVTSKRVVSMRPTLAQTKSPPTKRFHWSESFRGGAKEIRTPDLLSWEGINRCTPLVPTSFDFAGVFQVFHDIQSG